VSANTLNQPLWCLTTVLCLYRHLRRPQHNTADAHFTRCHSCLCPQHCAITQSYSKLLCALRNPQQQQLTYPTHSGPRIPDPMCLPYPSHYQCWCFHCCPQTNSSQCRGRSPPRGHRIQAQ
jgi:hypothetical protein